MSEALPNPLLDIHRQAGAEFQAYGQMQIVCTFGQLQAEYAAIRKSCALCDQPQRGFIELSGGDRLRFINNLLTNQTFDKQSNTPLAVGTAVYAFLLHPKNGRIITDVNVLELGERTLLELEARMVAPVTQELNKYLFAESVKITSGIGQFHQLALHGPNAHQLLEEWTDGTMPALPAMHLCQKQLAGVEAIIWRDDPCGVSGYHLILAAGDAVGAWKMLMERFGSSPEIGKRPLRPAGWAAFNSTRIEAGRPLFGVDFDDSVLPAETGQLGRAVSFTKGCYPGQEIVARMHARGQLARQLVGLRCADNALPMAGSPVMDEAGNTVGGITSSTISPAMSNAPIALGLVKRPLFAVGSVVNVPAEGAFRRAVVVELPFLKDSNTEEKT